MKKLYQKNEILFSVLLIVVYVLGASIMDSLSLSLGFEKIATLPFLVLLSLVLFVFIRKMGLLEKYGLSLPSLSPKKLLYYIPLAALSTLNFWFGFATVYSGLNLVLFILSMVFIGFLEELIFRGFLYKAMEKDSPKAAIIVSSVTFGIGHIINLFNGSGAELIPNICQIVSAIGFGFLFVALFIKSKSLLPCIISHSFINATSAFSASGSAPTDMYILLTVIMTIVAFIYAIYVFKKA